MNQEIVTPNNNISVDRKNYWKSRPSRSRKAKTYWHSEENSLWLHEMTYTGDQEHLDSLLSHTFCSVGITSPTRKQIRTLEQLLLNLLRIEDRYPDKCLRILMDNKHNDPETFQFRIFRCSGWVLQPLVYSLADHGIIDLRKGSVEDGKAEATKIKLITKEFEDFLDCKNLKCIQPPQVAFKKKGKLCVPDFSVNTKQYGSKIIEDYNNLLSRVVVSCKGVVIEDAQKHYTIEDSQKYYTRKFKDDTFSSGGRLYAGWQSLIHSEYRSDIRIDGVETREIDIRSCDLMLNYARLGLDVTTETEDLYYCDLLEPVWHYPEARKLTKNVIVTALNMKSRSRKALVNQIYNTVINPVKKSKKDKSDQWSTFIIEMYRRSTGKDVTLKEIIAAILDKHNAIEQFLGHGDTWHISQHTESNIIMDVIQFGVENEIAILTIHDGVVCEVEDVETIKQVWIQAIIKHTGVDFKHPERLLSVN
ncbi:hypothetical protein [Microbulbifer pacificus]|uniref:hypothetical protein n=1 Tax=Microbulbifer pacificus TaxID=407164 RepID=UPI001319DC89|nr:hypothetical protein [Microbulbifer pacificus]